VLIDDAGWGDPLGGVIIGIYRVETEEYLSQEIEVTHFQSPNFTQRTYLERGLELVLRGFQCLSVHKDEPIHVCRGVVLDRVREGLTELGYQVIPTKIEGRLQELVEANLVELFARLGLPDIPTVSGKERFFRQLEWIQEDLRRRERFAKTGWKNWPTKLRHWKPRWRQRQRGPKRPPVIIKLGGSVITDKTKPSTARLEVIRMLVEEIARVKSHPIILVHGGGSFGHFLAEKYELHHGGHSKTKKLGVTQTFYEMTELGQIILSAFQKARRPAVSIHSSSIIVTLKGRIAHMDLEALRFYLNGNFIPILSGDVTADSVTGFTIVSGDQIVMYLARLLNAPLVIFASDVDGLYTADPKQDTSAKRIPLITPATLEQVMEKVAMGAAEGAADVTEGMRGKITEILEGLPESGEAIVCDLREAGTLARILAGNDVPCTRLRH
jgi:isopentenyl phosphate kinase